MEIIEIERITSVEKITQNSQKLEITVRKAYCHFVESPERLIIYVPKKKEAQEICFRIFLPRKLAGWLMHPKGEKKGNVDFEMVNALTSLFASEEALIEDILSRLSIPEVIFHSPDGTREWKETYSDEEDEDESDRGGSKNEDESEEGFETCDDLPEESAILQGSPKIHETSPEVVSSTPEAPAETGPSQPEVELALRQADAPNQDHTGGGGDITGPSHIIDLSEPDSLPTPQVTAG
jgi:hypothetical protein